MFYYKLSAQISVETSFFRAEPRQGQPRLKIRVLILVFHALARSFLWVIHNRFCRRNMQK